MAPTKLVYVLIILRAVELSGIQNGGKIRLRERDGQIDYFLALSASEFGASP